MFLPTEAPILMMILKLQNQKSYKIMHRPSELDCQAITITLGNNYWQISEQENSILIKGLTYNTQTQGHA